jgi:hypothetical protein
MTYNIDGVLMDRETIKALKELGPVFIIFYLVAMLCAAVCFRKPPETEQTDLEQP